MRSVRFLLICSLSVVALLLSTSIISGVLPVKAEADTLVVDTPTDSNAPAYQACTDAPGNCSLRGAISRANADVTRAYRIELPAGRYALSLVGSEEDNATGDLDIRASLTLVGAGAGTTIVDACQIDRVLHIHNMVYDAKIAGITITGGKSAEGPSEVWGNDGAPGGGVLNWGVLTLERCVISGNIAGAGVASSCAPGDQGGNGGSGGGIANDNELTLNQCGIWWNSSGAGGPGSDCGRYGTRLAGVDGEGGGLYSVGYPDDAAIVTLTNVAILNNARGGLDVGWGSSTLLYTTIAYNDRSGVIVWEGSVAMTNAILVGESTALGVADTGSATLDGVLWYDNTIDYSGLVTVTHAVEGNPAFWPDDYHLAPGSAAIDRGVECSVTTDIDGQPRSNPDTGLPDLGADEYEALLFGSRLPLVLRGTSASIVPQGRIAFASYRYGNYEIYVMNADGSNQRNLTYNPGGDYSPAWSPDGSKIAFTSHRDGYDEIYVLNTNGSHPTRLTNNPGGDYSPAWSPDGSKIAFTSYRDGNAEIYVMNADGFHPTRLTNNPGGNYQPAWSPDGSRIAFTSHRDGNDRIYVMNADGSHQMNLMNNPAYDASPAWSPDGSKIAFTSGRDGNGEIYVMNADGSNPINLTNNPAEDAWPAWSPDGSKIAFISYRDRNSEIYAMNADGSNPINLTNNPAEDGRPAWSP